MKKVIGYIRISTKDQSNFSLDGQENYIIDYCRKNDFELVALFKDDGQSAKNFDRPDWKKLESFVKENHSSVDILLVSKYDRFSRNVADGLKMIESLENKYDIRVLSVMEPINLHPKSPYFFQFRTQMLLGAQVEWLIIRDRTKFGNHQAAKAGRFCSTAPFGYINSRDERNKPILVVDEAKALVVKSIYRMFLQGAPLREIQLTARMGGYKNGGKSAIKRTLSNCVYAGLIKVPAYYEEPQHYVKGIHQAIVDESTWYQVQEMLSGKPRKKNIYCEELPLRGVLKCFCTKLLTGYKAKGKSSYYWYYKCNDHYKFNLPATSIHAQLEAIIAELSFPPNYVEYLKEKVRELLQVQLKDQATMVTEKKQAVATIKKRIDSLEEKFLSNEIGSDTYKKWRERYAQELSVEESLLSDLQKPFRKIFDKFENALEFLTDLLYHYKRVDITTKQAFLRWVFNSELYYLDGIYRTPFLHPMFAHKAALLQEKKLLIIEKLLQNSNDSDKGAREGTIVEHLYPFLEWVEKISVA